MMEQQRKIREHQPDPNKFDLMTHHWNGQGEISRTNLYTCHVVDGNKYFERPINSGNLWFENNQPAGRVLYKNGVKSIDATAEHISYTAPLEGAEKLHFELENTRTELEAAREELAAIKAEAEKRAVITAPVGQTSGETAITNEAPSLKKATR